MTGNEKLRKENQSLRNEIAELKEKLQGFTFGDIMRWLVKEEDIRRPNSRTQVPHYMFILLKTLKKDLGVDHWHSQLSTICIFFMN